MNIVFFGSEDGKNTASINMVSVGVMASVLYSLKTILIQTHPNETPIQHMLEGKYGESVVEEDLYYHTRRGMDELLDCCSRGIINNGIINNNVINIRHTNINYISAPNEYEDNDAAYGKLMEMMKKFHNINLWDLTNCGRLQTEVLLEKSDVIVLNISGDTEISELDKGAENIYEKIVPASIKYNQQFLSALKRGRVISYIMRNIFAEKGSSDYHFINELFETTNRILRKAGIDGI